MVYPQLAIKYHSALGSFHPPVPSELVDSSHQVPWTCAPSNSLDGLKHVVLYHGKFFILPVPAFAIFDLGGVTRDLMGQETNMKWEIVCLFWNAIKLNIC